MNINCIVFDLKTGDKSSSRCTFIFLFLNLLKSAETIGYTMGSVAYLYNNWYQSDC